MEIKATAKEIADLVLALQGRRKQDLFVSNIGDFKVAAAAIHGRLPEALKRIANKDSESEERSRHEGPEDPQP